MAIKEMFIEPDTRSIRHIMVSLSERPLDESIDASQLVEVNYKMGLPNARQEHPV